MDERLSNLVIESGSHDGFVQPSLMVEINTDAKLEVTVVDGLHSGGFLMLDMADARKLRDWLNANVKD